MLTAAATITTALTTNEFAGLLAAFILLSVSIAIIIAGCAAMLGVWREIIIHIRVWHYRRRRRQRQ